MNEAFPLGERALAMLDALGECTEEPGRITRPFLSPAHRRAAELVLGWMTEAGLRAEINPVGTVVGTTRADGGAVRPRLLIGSHIDTVPGGGRFDGMLGVVAGILAVAGLPDPNALPFDIEVLAFGDEEGLRFPTASLGAASLISALPNSLLDSRDAEGISIREALERFGLAPEPRLAELRYDPRGVLGYLEVHIEQGPVLEQLGQPLGVVTSIAAAWRARVGVRGSGGHAGTVPMGMRADALAAASAMILAIERSAIESPVELRATVGELSIANSAANAIPSEVAFSIDLRAPHDDDLADARTALVAALREVAAERSVGLELQSEYEGCAAQCDESLSATLAEAVEGLGLPATRLHSGAGHDAQTIAGLAPIAMLFVRCRGGVSHLPEEEASAADMDLAVRALTSAILRRAHDAARDAARETADEGGSGDAPERGAER